MRPELAAKYPALTRELGYNPHGGTIYAEYCRRAVLGAERQLLAAAGIPEQEAAIIWCANATEAANLALRGFAKNYAGAMRIALDLGAHPALTETARDLDAEVDGFVVGPHGKLSRMLRPGTALAALSMVNHETGVMWRAERDDFPPGTCVLLDASQGFGKHPLPWRAADMVIISSRKIGGPAAVAALIVRRGVQLQPVITGGGQQSGVRAGTLDAVSCVLFAEAASLACQEAPAALTKIAALNHELRAGIAAAGQGRWPCLSPEDASPYICTFAIPGCEGAIISRTLAERGILVGTGSACSAESPKTSDVLAAFGVSEELARETLRVSFGHDSTPEELRMLLEVLPAVVRNY